MTVAGDGVAGGEVFSIMQEGAAVTDSGALDALGHEGMLQIYRWMVLLRTFDERAVSLQRQGRLGTYPMFWGEEATQAGPLYACAEDDWVFPSYRQGAIGILRGLPPSVILKYRRGFGGTHGFWNPRRLRVGPSTISIATHLPHAVGLCYAAKVHGDAIAAIVFFGDGATSEGDFHEAMNLASVMRTPTVFFCVNNQWAISTPYHRQTATATIAEKAAAYGMPARRVDGFDAFACWKVTHDALVHARRGGGPTLIEAFCYRLAPHGTADEPGRYRDEAVTADWKRLEPVGRTASYLRARGILDDAIEAETRDLAISRIAEAVVEAERLAESDPDILFDTLYASGRPSGLDEGRTELRSVQGDR
jgi:pyruvate dehydrogenase E1 component alpha subunit